MRNPLEAEVEGKWRVHIRTFVLIYTFERASNTLTLLTLEHTIHGLMIRRLLMLEMILNLK